MTDPAVRIAASLWSVPAPQHSTCLDRLRDAGLEAVHWDLTDGVFAVSGGFHAERARDLTATSGLAAEAHLMVTDPLDHVDAWTDFCELVVVHAESRDWIKAMARIEARGARPALALSPGTPLSVVPSSELAVLTMSITPGEAGATFDSHALTTVAALRAASVPRGPTDPQSATDRHVPTVPLGTSDPHADTRWLGLDGGVTRDIAVQARAAGANWLISGTDLCGSPDPAGWLTTAQSP